MMPLRAAGVMLIGLATAGCSPPSTPPHQTPGVIAPPSTTAMSAPTSSAVPTLPAAPPANPATVTVTVAMFEQFTELPGGRCAGYGTFTGLDDNNIAYLTGATIESFATGSTKSSTFPNPFSKGTNACDITVTFTPRPPDPGGYHLQVGNPGQWKAGPYTADPGPLGMIRLAACPPTQPSCGA